MSKWLILHTGSRLSEALYVTLSKKAVRISVDELVTSTRVRVALGDVHQHHWVSGSNVVSEFGNYIIYQEVFYGLDMALQDYSEADRGYVRHSWQAYLLGVFAKAKYVINPVSPQSITVSQYQFPRLCKIASYVGFSIPSFEVGIVPDYPHDAFASLWYLAKRQEDAAFVMYVEKPKQVLTKVCFVRYDKTFIACWPEIPAVVKQRLLILCSMLNVSYGEVSFEVMEDWVFYGLIPSIQSSSPDDEVLLEIAACIKDLGSGEIE